MEQGWVKIYRQITEWQHYQEPSVLLVWLDLLLSANTVDRWERGFKVKRGEVMTSTNIIQQRTGLSPNTIKKAVAILEESGEIKKVATRMGTKYIVKQFNKYQGSSKIDQPTDQHNKNIRINNERMKEDIEFSNENSMSGSGGTPTKPESINFENLVANFNRVTKGVFGVVQLPLSEQRKKCIRARIREHGKETFMEVIHKAAASDFLKGQNQRGFTATFDWLIKPSNFEKVLSGNYDNHSGAVAGGQGYKGDATIGTDFSYKE